MFSFRQKILMTYVLVFLIFIGLTFPFAQRAVNDISLKGMQNRATELIQELRKTRDDEALVSLLKELKSGIFFRVSVINNHHNILYDSHTKRIIGKDFSQHYKVHHPEVLEAFNKGFGYHEEYSEILERDLAYYAKAFYFHGKPYVLRLAFPLDYNHELRHDFEIGMITVTAGVLLLFSIMTWFIMNHITRPIQRIIDVVKPYQEGKTTEFPSVDLRSHNPNDEFSQLAHTLNDLSLKIQDQINNLTEERNEKKVLLDSLVEGVVAVDKNMVVTYLNSMASKFIHTNEKNIKGKDFQSINRPEFSELLKLCQEQNEILVDTIQVKRRGQKMYLDLIAAPIKSGLGAILVIQDKSAHHQMMEMRRDFVANASHELKTPITIIKGFAEALQENPDLPPDTVQEIIHKVVRNCGRMEVLIKDLLTLSDVENIPESRLEKLDLVQVLAESTQIVRDAYPDSKISVELKSDRDFFMMGDRKLLDMAFLNLLANAAKYSLPPAEIRVIFDHLGDWVKVSIVDYGMGIPEEDLENIFIRFYRVDKSRSKRMGGTGLGLSIVQTIIDKHFGKISVESQLGKGSVFTILLPVQR